MNLEAFSARGSNGKDAEEGRALHLTHHRGPVVDLIAAVSRNMRSVSRGVDVARGQRPPDALIPGIHASRSDLHAA